MHPTHPRPTKRLYTLPEAAIYLGRSTWSVRRLVWDGGLPRVRAGRRVHIDVRDMDEFIDKHKETDAP
jgi:excisionase family DNA binding protein